jgi:hypothetical protein
MPYKVVSLENGERVSANVTGLAQRVYEPGVPTEAPDWLLNSGYGLLYFENQEDAAHWANYWFNEGDPYEIWRVWPEGEMEAPSHQLRIYELTHGRIEPSYAIWPTGTKMARELTLLEKI